MLVINKMDVNLREYVQQSYNQLTWKERIRIAFLIVDALRWIHKENLVHRDLHSGNILFSYDFWRISDLGFCGPADKPSTSIYGNLPYIAPEVIVGRKYSFASDIYSVGMLMWEISSGQLPFSNYEHDSNLAMNIVNGIRPRVVPGTPLEYENLMKQCWDADPLKRPKMNTLLKKISEINASYQNVSDESQININLNTNNLEMNYTSKRLFTSKVHQFENFPEPRNATEGMTTLYFTRFYITTIFY
jgi:serine/threonine protein kinase